MAILVIKMKPCLVWIINPLEVAGFLLIGIVIHISNEDGNSVNRLFDFNIMLFLATR